MTNNINSKFWDEICGTARFRSLGLKEISPESLKKFDSWYMEYYPYLHKYLPLKQLKDKSVLEIGLGFGTIGEKLFLSAKKYIGVDYAQNPVDLMNLRIKYRNKNNAARAIRADALSLPFDKETFDFIVSIGCLHHTGDVNKSVQEIYRVLKPGGQVLVMLYNKNSFFRIIILPIRYCLLKIFKKYNKNYDEFVRFCYDSNSQSQAAPITEFLSGKEIKKIFSNLKFKEILIRKERFFNVYIPGTRIGIPRQYLLNNIGKIWGLDFYITAIK